ncbi:MAG: endonuclease III domain-containing protein [Chloroflexota bacterium]
MAMDIPAINDLLARQHGERKWHRRHDPLSELIATILSQNTSDVNSGRAFDSLMGEFETWEEVASADVTDIERAIRSGGISHVKAVRVKEILRAILDERGSLDLEFLERLPVDEAKSWLRRLPGVGPKTIGCVLMFSFGKPVMPVDTHVYRVARRLGLIEGKASVEQAHELLEAMVLPGEVYQLHLNMVEHGRRVCKSRRPMCSECILQDACPSNRLDDDRGLETAPTVWRPLPQSGDRSHRLRNISSYGKRSVS